MKTVLDLFWGGGFSKRFEKAGYKIGAGVDKNTKSIRIASSKFQKEAKFLCELLKMHFSKF